MMAHYMWQWHSDKKSVRYPMKRLHAKELEEKLSGLGMKIKKCFLLEDELKALDISHRCVIMLVTLL